ncbi:hypothetical protein HQ496_00825 [bacterium]|nr:hypothetical protein [bacterium]
MTLYDSDSQEWLDDRIEAYLDGSLPTQDLARFKALAAGNDEVQQALDVARLISASLRSLPDEPCPDFVSRNVMSHVRHDLRKSAWQRVESFFMGIRITYLKPVFAVAALVLIVVSSTQIGGQVGVESAQSEAEVSQALSDVKWTLAYLSGVGKNTGTTVKANVIEDQMVGPMSRSINVLSEN